MTLPSREKYKMKNDMSDLMNLNDDLQDVYRTVATIAHSHYFVSFIAVAIVKLWRSRQMRVTVL